MARTLFNLTILAFFLFAPGIIRADTIVTAPARKVFLAGVEYRVAVKSVFDIEDFSAGDIYKQGYVEAWETKSGKTIWEKKIADNSADQKNDIYITGMVIRDDKLVVIDKNDTEYIIEPKTGEITYVAKKETRKEFYPNGQSRSEIPYRYGKINGTVKIYYENGQVMRIVPYKDGKKSGTAQNYLPNGELNRNESYDNDKLHGRVEDYHNGKLMVETPYRNGKKQGIKKYYDWQGILQEEIPYKNDEIDGIRKFYDSDGVARKIIYRNGQCLNNGSS
ncbi:MAG: toxin-antitoxin system YwqK family antitoxin [Candidatus Omnitrophota bacterium]